MHECKSSVIWSWCSLLFLLNKADLQMWCNVLLWPPPPLFILHPPLLSSSSSLCCFKATVTPQLLLFKSDSCLTSCARTQESLMQKQSCMLPSNKHSLSSSRSQSTICNEGRVIIWAASSGLNTSLWREGGFWLTDLYWLSGRALSLSLSLYMWLKL